MKKEEKNENKNEISEESKIFESIASEEKISLTISFFSLTELFLI